MRGGDSTDWKAMYDGLCEQTISGAVVLPSGITTIRYGLFYGCASLTSLTIPNSVTSIGVAAFYGCSGLTGSLTIPDTVTSIADSAFYGCTSLNGTLTLGAGLTSIGTTAFNNCPFTGALVIPNSVTTIGNQAFRGTHFTSADIGTGVTNISAMAFYATYISCVVLRATTPPTLGNANAFSGSYPIYVPDASVTTYKAANNWSALASRIFPISDLEGAQNA